MMNIKIVSSVCYIASEYRTVSDETMRRAQPSRERLSSVVVWFVAQEPHSCLTGASVPASPRDFIHPRFVIGREARSFRASSSTPT